MGAGSSPAPTDSHRKDGRATAPAPQINANHLRLRAWPFSCTGMSGVPLFFRRGGVHAVFGGYSPPSVRCCFSEGRQHPQSGLPAEFRAACPYVPMALT